MITNTFFEYAGFHYQYVGGQMVPLPNQHPAAYKEKHRMAAKELFLAEQERVRQSMGNSQRADDKSK